MTPEPTARRSYRVTSLERGLTLLKTLGSAGNPMRNQDLVARTGLPKATVSRLVHTLTSLGYLRRTDQGSYVPADLGSRSGRVMLAGLDLGRHAPFFAAFLDDAGGEAVLETRAGDTLVPVFRWSAHDDAPAGHLPSDGARPQAPSAQACFEHAYGDRDAVEAAYARQLQALGWCHSWDPASRDLVASIPASPDGVDGFVLTVHRPAHAAPDDALLASTGRFLADAAWQLGQAAPAPQE